MFKLPKFLKKIAFRKFQSFNFFHQIENASKFTRHLILKKFNVRKFLFQDKRIYISNQKLLANEQNLSTAATTYSLGGTNRPAQKGNKVTLILKVLGSKVEG